MKKAILFLILAAMLTGCTNSENETATAVTPEIIQTVTTVTAASSPETETTTTSDPTETTETSDTTAESTSKTDTEMTVTSVTEASVSASITSTRKPESQSGGGKPDTNTTTTKAVTSISAETRRTTTTVKSGSPKGTTLASVTSSKPESTTTTTKAETTTTTTTAAAPSGVKWSDSMKVWRKLCEGKKLTGSEQDLIRSEILDYAVSSFNGKKDIHVSFGIDSYDISYEKPLNLKANKKMTSMSNAHMDAYADPNRKALIDYAKSETEIFEIVTNTRQKCLHIIDHGLFNRWEIFTINNELKYASDIDFGIGFDEDMAIWFLT